MSHLLAGRGNLFSERRPARSRLPLITISRVDPATVFRTWSIDGFAIRVEGPEKVFREGDVQVRAVRHVDLEVRPGELVLITGPSGGGKTTRAEPPQGSVVPPGLHATEWTMNRGSGAEALRRSAREPQAFVPLYEVHPEALLVYPARRAHDADAALDLMSETFARANGLLP